MRKAVPGTCHSSPLHRNECAILEAIQQSPGVKKLKSGRVAQTGSPRQLLHLRPHVLAGKIESIVAGWLYIARGKRQLTIYTAPEVTLEALRDKLAAALHDFVVPVEVFENHKPTEEIPMPSYEANGRFAATEEERWQYCVLIRDLVEQATVHESEEASFLAEAERARALKLRAKEDALEALAQGFVPRAS